LTIADATAPGESRQSCKLVAPPCDGLCGGGNLRAIAQKKFKPQTTDSKPDLPVCANLLQNRVNAATANGEVFIGDIT
jgi:hypothetical protein